jgi:hypothetical protein
MPSRSNDSYSATINGLGKQLPRPYYDFLKMQHDLRAIDCSLDTAWAAASSPQSQVSVPVFGELTNLAVVELYSDCAFFFLGKKAFLFACSWLCVCEIFRAYPQ